MGVLDRFRLDGKRCFLTGGSRGLGREMALAIAEAGADLILVGRDRPALPGRDDPADDLPTATAALFARIAARAGNADLQAAIGTANARLHPARLAEARLFDAPEAEFAQLRDLLAEDDMATLRSRLVAYRRRRILAAGRIVQLLHRPEPGL